MLSLEKSVSTSCFSDRWYPSLRVRCVRPARPTRRSKGRSGQQASAHNAAVELDNRPAGRGNVIPGRVGCIACAVGGKRADDGDDASEEAEAENRYYEVLLAARELERVDCRYRHQEDDEIGDDIS